MFLDGVSIFLIFVPLLLPIVQYYKWDPVWFGVILTLKVALGQFTPPLAVNLMVSCRIAKVRMEETVRWVGWMLFSMFLVMVLVIAFPELALVAAAEAGVLRWDSASLCFVLFGYAALFGARTRRRGTFLRECPPACGLLLYFAAQGTPSTCALCSSRSLISGTPAACPGAQGIGCSTQRNKGGGAQPRGTFAEGSTRWPLHKP